MSGHILCRTKVMTMYPGKPFAYYHMRCEHEDEEYGMNWVPPHCPVCGCVLVVTEYGESNGGEE